MRGQFEPPISAAATLRLWHPFQRLDELVAHVHRGIVFDGHDRLAGTRVPYTGTEREARDEARCAARAVRPERGVSPKMTMTRVAWLGLLALSCGAAVQSTSPPVTPVAPVAAARPAMAEPVSPPVGELAPDQPMPQITTMRQAFELGQAAYDERRFAEAAQFFLRGYELSGSASMIYNAAVSFEKLGEHARAHELLIQYLLVTHRARDREQAEKILGTLIE